MTRRLGSMFVVMLVVIQVDAQDTKKQPNSGPRIGQPVSFFNPLDINTGEKKDIVEEFGKNPVIMIFARQVDDSLKQLVRALDAKAGEPKNKAAFLKAVVIMLTDNEVVPKAVKKFQQSAEIYNVRFAQVGPGGPHGYNINKEADLTVILYQNYKVKYNHAFRKGELDMNGLAAILADVPKIVTNN